MKQTWQYSAEDLGGNLQKPGCLETLKESLWRYVPFVSRVSSSFLTRVTFGCIQII